MKVSVCICVKNQREHMVELLKLITGYVDDIVIIDGMSEDGTYEACLAFPVRIYRLPSRGPDADRGYAVEQANNNCVLMLDADERPSGTLLKNLDEYTLSGYNGFWITRRNYYTSDKYYKHIHYPDYQLRLFNRRYTTISSKVHATPSVKGKTLALDDTVYLEHLEPIYSNKSKYSQYAKVQAQEWVAKWPRLFYPFIAVYQAIKDFVSALINGCLLDGAVGLKAGLDRAYYTGLVYYYMTFKE